MMPAIVSLTVPAIPAAVIQAIAIAANQVVLAAIQAANRNPKVNRPANRIRKIQAATIIQYRAIRNRVTRSQVTPVAAVPVLAVALAKAEVIQ
jgi:hypothetical protein